VSRDKAKEFQIDEFSQFASVLGKRMWGPDNEKMEHDKATRSAAYQSDEERLSKGDNNRPGTPENSDSDSHSSFSITSEFETKKNKKAKLSQGMCSTDHTKEILNTAHLNPQFIRSPC